jgi:hopene-associated glycosyltransferase HpnB
VFWLGPAALAAWAAVALFRGGFWRMRIVARPRFEGPWPAVGIVVPARNEEGLAGRAVGSLAVQEYAGRISITLVDDHSADRTAAEARAAGAEVTAAHPLPPGWTGKLWALTQGAEHALAANPRYLFFTDADIVHAPGHVADLVARAETGGCDLVSHMVLLHCETPAERALIPAFVFLFFKLYPPAWSTGAAGGSIIIRADALRRAGGLEAIRGELIDDCALAAAVRRTGGKVRLELTREAWSIRPYALGDIFRMISRTAFTQLRHSPVLLAGTVAGMLCLYIAPPALALSGNILGAAAWALMTLLYLPAVHWYRLSPLWAFMLPAAALFYIAATIDSAVRHWRGEGGAWKGRVLR